MSRGHRTNLPMMAEWLEANSPALDIVVSEAVRKPVFYCAEDS